MRIHACLSWYNEQPDHLARLIRSLHTHRIQHLIAVDGPYSLYPHQHHRSTDDEYDVLTEAEALLDVTTYTPPHAWAGNELEKRNQLFALAHQLADPGDWLLVIDADMHITHGDLTALEHTTTDVATATLYGDGNDRPHRCLFRTQPTGIHLGNHHADYRTGDGRTLWNPCNLTAQLPATQIDLMIQHDPHLRDSGRNMARLAYYDRARDERIEVNA